MDASLSPCKGKSFKTPRQYIKLLPLQGALPIAIIPRALPWAKSFCPFRACCLLGVLLVWASALAERAACMSFCPFRACCLLGVLLVWASALAERAACMSFCPFRACCLYGLLPLLGVLLVWASAPSGRAACMGFCPYRGRDAPEINFFSSLLLISRRCWL